MLKPKDAELEAAGLIYMPNVAPAPQANAWLDRLRGELDWSQHRVRVFGKVHGAPRLSAWHGDADCEYTYSALTLVPAPWTPTLLQIRAVACDAAGVEFNAVLANWYRDGNDSMGWHSDDEPELGENPVLGSLSLGEPRRFRMRDRSRRQPPFGFDLMHGSFLILTAHANREWQHSIPKTARRVGDRINLTFRRVTPTARSTPV